MNCRDTRADMAPGTDHCAPHGGSARRARGPWRQPLVRSVEITPPGGATAQAWGPARLVLDRNVACTYVIQQAVARDRDCTLRGDTPTEWCARRRCAQAAAPRGSLQTCRSGGREPRFGVLTRSPGGSKLGSWRGSPGGLEFSGKKRIFVIFEKL